jgi:nitroreductase
MVNVAERVSRNEPKTATPLLRVGPNFAHFAPRDISDSCLGHVLEIARLSPSEWNFQTWRWIVVRSEGGKQQLEAATLIKVPVGSAPVVLICMTDTLAWKTAPERLRDMVANHKMTEEEANELLRRIGESYSLSPEIARRAALASSFVALHQVLLAASDCGLSANWVTEFNEQKIKMDFHIPDSFLVAALLPLGYREETQTSPVPVSKAPLLSLVYKEKFGEKFEKL